MPNGYEHLSMSDYHPMPGSNQTTTKVMIYSPRGSDLSLRYMDIKRGFNYRLQTGYKLLGCVLSGKMHLGTINGIQCVLHSGSWYSFDNAYSSVPTRGSYSAFSLVMRQGVRCVQDTRVLQQNQKFSIPLKSDTQATVAFYCVEGSFGVKIVNQLRSQNKVVKIGKSETLLVYGFGIPGDTSLKVECLADTAMIIAKISA